MTQTNVNVQMQIRRDTAANWNSTNPVLLAGEWGYVTDTNIFKIGNGTTGFSFLPEALLSSNGSYSSSLFISNYHLKITSQKELRFSDDVDGATGEHYSSFKAGSQSANINYTLPTTAPTDNQYLKCSAAGVLSWDSFTGTDIADLVSNDANNRILTATGTTNSFNAEANLEFNASHLTIKGASASTVLELQRTDTNTAGCHGTLNFTASDGHSVASIGTLGDGDNEGADIVFRTTSAAASNDPFNAATPVRMTIDSSGNIGIGVTSPSGPVHVYKSSGTSRSYFESGDSHTFIRLLGGSASHNSGIEFFSGSSTNTANITALSTGAIKLDTGSTNDALTINSSGAVGIGTTLPQANLDLVDTNASLLVRPSDGNAGEARLFLGGGGANQLKSAIIFDPAGGFCRGDLKFCVENTADTSNVDSTDAKLIIQANGDVAIGSNNVENIPLHVQGASGQATIFKLKSLETTVNQQWMTSANANCLHQYDGLSFNTYTPSSSGSLELQHQINLHGITLTQGKGINFHNYGQGTNITGNQLNDYEEGYWDPEIYTGMDDGSGSVATLLVQHGRYTKIGNHVTVNFYIQLNVAFSTAAQLVISGLPFNITTPAENSSGFGMTTYHNLSSLTVGSVILAAYGLQNTNRISFFSGVNTVQSTNNTNHNSQFIIGGFTYFTES